MSKPNEGTLEKLGNRLGELLRDLERLLNPEQPKRVPVPVPVPVRQPRPTRRSY